MDKERKTSTDKESQTSADKERRGIRLILLGPPGSGKGSQSSRILQHYGGCYLATGDILREAIRNGTELGKKAKAIIDRGELVPDDVMVNLIKENIKSPQCQQGFVLDGFPRTIPQAEKLDALLREQNVKLDKVLEFKVKEDLLFERITGRLVHPRSGRVYHTKYNPPKVPMKDDMTGEPLIQRSDDTAEVLKKRLETYKKNTAPLIEYYRKQNLLAVVNAEKSIDEVWNDISNILRNNKL
jgi:adenylate kinase